MMLRQVEARQTSVERIAGVAARPQQVLGLCYPEQIKVVPEGGCYGGLITGLIASDLQEIVPLPDGYDERRHAVIWLYEFEPMQLVRAPRRLFERGRLSVKARKAQPGHLYYGLVPREMTDAATTMTLIGGR